VRFRLPEPVLAAPERELTEGTWMSHETPEVSVMMQVPQVGCFVRCLLPVHLSGGFEVRFGVWLGVAPDDLQRAVRVWWEPEYSQLVLDGRLANRLPIWDCLAAPARASVRSAHATPYISGSADALLSQVISEEWPHEPVLAALPK